MALKYNNNEVKVVKFNNNDVNKVIKDGTVVWLKSYQVTLSPTSLTGCNEVFLTTDNTAVSGTHSSGYFDYGSTVYAIAAVNSTNLGLYDFSSWGDPKNSSGGYNFYQAGSVYVDGNKTISLTAPTAKTTFTITLDGTGLVWKQGTTIKTSMTAYKNDVITQVNSTTIACSYVNAGGGLAERWRLTVSRAPDTNTTTYSGTPSIPNFASWTVTSDKKLSAIFTVTGVSGTTRKYTVKIVATTGVSSTFISTSSTATSGTNTTSGASMSYSTTTYYGFVKVANSTVLANTMPTTWERIGISGSYTIYKVWSGQITGNVNYNPGTMTPRTGTVTVSKASYMSGIYLSTSATTAPGNGSPSGSTFNVGTTVYAIATFTSNQYTAIASKPTTWGTVNYNGSYYYCSVGSTTVVEGANTITYTAPTIKTQLPAPSASVKTSGSNYIAEIHSNTNISTTVYVTWYNASTNASLGSATVSPGSYGTSTTTLALTSASSVYVKAYAVASGYVNSETTKSVTCYQPTLSDPVLAGQSASSVSGGYKYTLTIKNNNSVAVTCYPEYGNNITIAANSTGTVTFTRSSSYDYVRCYFSASGYQDSDVVDWYIEYTPPSSGGTTR